MIFYFIWSKMYVKKYSCWRFWFFSFMQSVAICKKKGAFFTIKFFSLTFEWFINKVRINIRQKFCFCDPPNPSYSMTNLTRDIRVWHVRMSILAFLLQFQNIFVCYHIHNLNWAKWIKIFFWVRPTRGP